MGIEAVQRPTDDAGSVHSGIMLTLRICFEFHPKANPSTRVSFGSQQSWAKDSESSVFSLVAADTATLDLNSEIVAVDKLANW